jgi:hypothetical protein
MAIVLIFLQDGHGKVKNEKWLSLQWTGSGSRNYPQLDCSFLSQTNGMGLLLGD